MSPFPTAIPFHSSSSSISTPFNTQRPSSLHTLIPYHPPLPLFLIPPPSQAPPIFLNLNWVQKNGSSPILGRPQSLLSRKSEGFASSDNCDRELRIVLELATESELYELEGILFGKSYFSPLLKSIAKRGDIDYVMIEEDPDEREEYIGMLESRFFYLAADARSTLRGWRPSYRSVLLDVRKLLNIRCSAKLPTEDLEAEIFLHLLQEYSTGKSGMFSHANENLKTSESDITLEHGLDQWKVQVAAALRRGPGEIKSMVLKGSGMLTLGKMYELLASSLSGKVFQEAAKYQIKKELIKKGGQLAAISLESRAALLATRKGLAVAASRYLGLRSMMQLLGPMLWGTLLADVVIQMLGTDYARILRAIYALAQIRILRTYR